MSELLPVLDARYKVLASAGRSGPLWAQSGSGATYTFFEETIPGGAVEPGAFLEFDGIWEKYAPAGGNSISIIMAQGANEVIIGAAGLTGANRHFAFKHTVQISDDFRWIYPSIDQTMYNQSAGFSTDGSLYGSGFFRTGGNSYSRSPRAKSAVALATYSAPPTVETLLVDLSQDWKLRVKANLQPVECAELIGFTARSLYSAKPRGGNPTKCMCIWGDSLLENLISTNEDLASQVGKLSPGRPVMNEGLGGQTSQLIVDRAVAAKVRGKYWDTALWIGTNDAGPDGPAWFATIDAQIQRFLAVRDASAKPPIIVGLHPQSTFNSTYLAAVQYVNTALAAKYGSYFASTSALLDGTNYVQSGYLTDAVHLNAAGIAVVAAAVNARIVALGW